MGLQSSFVLCVRTRAHAKYIDIVRFQKNPLKIASIFQSTLLLFVCVLISDVISKRYDYLVDAFGR